MQDKHSAGQRCEPCLRRFKVFAGFLAYAIVRYRVFEIRLLAIRVFLIALCLAVLAPALVEGIPRVYAVIAIISFIAVAALSVLILRINDALVSANAKLAEQEQFECRQYLVWRPVNFYNDQSFTLMGLHPKPAPVRLFSEFS